jgi:hypothetical protein
MLYLHAKALPLAFRAFCSVPKIPFAGSLNPVVHAACGANVKPRTHAPSCIRLTKAHPRHHSICSAASSGNESALIVCGNLKIQRIKCLSDNYAWLISSSTKTAVVDPSESGRPQVTKRILDQVGHNSPSQFWQQLFSPVLTTKV